MRKNEKAFISIAFIGFMLKISLVPYGQWILLIGIGLLANTYFFGFNGVLNNESYLENAKQRKLQKKNSLYQLIAPYSIVIIIIGMLFKIMAWPGAKMLLLAGIVLALGGVYFVNKNETETKTWKIGAYKRMIIYGLFGLVFYVLPNFFWFDIVYREHPAYIKATKDFYSDPENEDYKLRMLEERERIDNGD